MTWTWARAGSGCPGWEWTVVWSWVKRRPESLLADRGSSLAEAMVATGLTAVAMAGLATLLGSSARTTERISSGDPLAGVAIDWLAGDLRLADGVDVVNATGDQVVSLDIEIDGGTVRWGSSDGSLTRLAPGEASPASIAGGLRTTDALVITLRDGGGDVVSPVDAAFVDGCTVMVEIQVVGSGDDVIHERTVGLRHRPGVTPTC